jgi:hypothetical protein
MALSPERLSGEGASPQSERELVRSLGPQSSVFADPARVCPTYSTRDDWGGT